MTQQDVPPRERPADHPQPTASLETERDRRDPDRRPPRQRERHVAAYGPGW